MSKKRCKKVLFTIPPDVHLLDITGPAHIFYEANEFGAKTELHYITLTGKHEIKSSAGIYFNNLEHYENFELEKNDLIFIPGLEFELLSDDGFYQSIRPFITWLKKQNDNRANICSICTGSFILGESGILDGRKSTTHWKYFDRFSERFPKVALERESLFVSSGNIHCSAGVSSGIDLSLFLLEKFFGTKLALDVAKEVVIYFRREASDPQLSIFLEYRNHLDQRIHQVQDLISKGLSKPSNIEELAGNVHMSKRNLTRLFKKITGITIGEYLEKIRVERAIALLGKGHKISFVAEEIGLKSSNQLRSILKKHKGILPSDLALK